MTPETFRAHLSRLGLSQAGFGRFIGYSDRSIRRFASGSDPVPLVVQRLLAEMKTRTANSVGTERSGVNPLTNPDNG